MEPKVQVSLDVTSIEEAIALAHQAMQAGVDWLEAGTPLILAEGLHGVRALRKEFPSVPIIADLKTMDGGYLEAEMMAQAGATMVVVMGQAHDATIRAVVKAGKEHGLKVMGDNLAAADKVACSRRLEELGVDYLVHHTGYDERREVKASPLDELREVVRAVSIPVQAVGGLTIDQAVSMPKLGAPLVVLGAPLVIDADAFHVADLDVVTALRDIVRRIREV